MAGLRPPRVPGRPVPVFSAGDMLRLERACAGRSFQQRRDAAKMAVFRAIGIRLSDLAGGLHAATWTVRVGLGVT